MHKPKIFLISLAFLSLIFCSGCYYCTYDIKSVPEASLKPCPVKFYIASIKTQYIPISEEGKKQSPQEFTAVQETELIKKNLLSKYPDFFVSDKTQGVNVDFYWNIDCYPVGYKGTGSCIPSAFTLGVIPFIHTADWTGTLSAKNKKLTIPGENIAIAAEEGVQHNIGVTGVLLGPFFMPLSGSIAVLFIPKKDISCFGDGEEIYRTPFRFCEANLPLFPAACMKYYNALSSEEKQILLDKYNPEDISFLTK